MKWALGLGGTGLHPEPPPPPARFTFLPAVQRSLLWLGELYGLRGSHNHRAMLVAPALPQPWPRHRGDTNGVVQITVWAAVSPSYLTGTW